MYPASLIHHGPITIRSISVLLAFATVVYSQTSTFSRFGDHYICVPYPPPENLPVNTSGTGSSLWPLPGYPIPTSPGTPWGNAGGQKGAGSSSGNASPDYSSPESRQSDCWS